MMPPPTPTSPTRSPVPRPAVTRTTACIHSISTTAFLGIAIQLDHHHPVNDYRREARDRPIRFAADQPPLSAIRDRKSTRLNSSHVANSYAVFCLKKKKEQSISG